MVEDAAQRVVGVVALGSHLDRLRDGYAEAAVGLGVVRQDRPSGSGAIGGAREHLGPVDLHHAAPVRLLMVAHLDHVDLQAEAEHLAGHREGRAPLSGAGLRGDPGDARLLVVEGLRHGGVRLVGARRAHAFMLEEDLGLRADGLLEPGGADKRRRPPDAVDLPHFLRDRDEPFGGRLLGDEAHREERRQVIRSGRLQGARMQGRRRRLGEVRRDVVPLCGDSPLVQHLFLVHDTHPSLLVSDHAGAECETTRCGWFERWRISWLLIAGCGRGPCGCEEEARYARQAQRRVVAAVPRGAPRWRSVV